MSFSTLGLKVLVCMVAEIFILKRDTNSELEP